MHKTDPSSLLSIGRKHMHEQHRAVRRKQKQFINKCISLLLRSL